MYRFLKLYCWNPAGPGKISKITRFCYLHAYYIISCILIRVVADVPHLSLFFLHIYYRDITFPDRMIVEVDNHIPRDKIFDYHPLRECYI